MRQLFVFTVAAAIVLGNLQESVVKYTHEEPSCEGYRTESLVPIKECKNQTLLTITASELIEHTFADDIDGSVDQVEVVRQRGSGGECVTETTKSDALGAEIDKVDRGTKAFLRDASALLRKNGGTAAADAADKRVSEIEESEAAAAAEREGLKEEKETMKKEGKKKSKFCLSITTNAWGKKLTLAAGEVWNTRYGNVVFIGSHQLLTTMYLTVIRAEKSKSHPFKSMTQIKSIEFREKVQDRDLLARVVAYFKTKPKWLVRWPGALEEIQKKLDETPADGAAPVVAAAAAAAPAAPELEEKEERKKRGRPKKEKKEAEEKKGEKIDVVASATDEGEEEVLEEEERKGDDVPWKLSLTHNLGKRGSINSGEVWKTTKYGKVVVVGFLRSGARDIPVVLRMLKAKVLKPSKALAIRDLSRWTSDHNLLKKAIVATEESNWKKIWPGFLEALKKQHAIQTKEKKPPPKKRVHHSDDEDREFIDSDTGDEEPVAKRQNSKARRRSKSRDDDDDDYDDS